MQDKNYQKFDDFKYNEIIVHFLVNLYGHFHPFFGSGTYLCHFMQELELALECTRRHFRTLKIP